MDGAHILAETSSVVLASVLLIAVAFATPACNDHPITADVYRGRFFSSMTISSNITMKNLATTSVYGCNEACWRLPECIAISYNMSYIGEGNCKLFNLTRIQKHMEAASDSTVILQLPVLSTQEWSPWSPWSVCSVSCGCGTVIKTRTCFLGESCNGTDQESRTCNTGVPCTENVALGKTCAQSSTGQSAPCDRAIDGNPNPDSRLGSCSNTAENVNPWWRVDLGRSYVVSNVTVVNRKGPVVKLRLDNFDIRVGNSLDENGNVNQMCVSGVKYDPELVRTFECVRPLTGRYVNVQIIHPGQVLTLCEVIVMGM